MKYNKNFLKLLCVSLIALSISINIISAFIPTLPTRLEFINAFMSIELRELSRLIAVLSSLVMLLVLRGLSRFKRSAWLITVFALSINVIAHLLKGFDYEEVIFDGSILLLLFLTRKLFNVKSDAPSSRQGVRLLVLSLFFIAIYISSGLFMLGEQLGLTSPHTIWPISFEPQTRLAAWFIESVYITVLLSMVLSVIFLLRPVIIRQSASHTDWQKAATLVERYGNSGLSCFTILGDKQFYFEGEDAFVSYKPLLGVGLALGDPIGEEKRIAKAIQGFKDHCSQNAWKAVFYQTLPDHLDQYRDAGFQVTAIGQEAIIDLHSFSLQGKAAKPLRLRLNRLSKLGYVSKVYEAPQSPDFIKQLEGISDDWLRSKKGSEKDFSLGSFTYDYIGGSDIITIEDSLGTIVAFANLVSEYQKNELTFDLMRYSQAAPEDTMTNLILHLVSHAKAQGYDSLNLGLVALAGLENATTRAEKLLHYAYEHLNQFYNFKGLYEFKDKFDPRWETRYLIYPKKGDLLQALEAIALADSSVGFWGEVRS